MLELKLESIVNVTRGNIRIQYLAAAERVL